MTGTDIAFWLEGIFNDLTDLGADVPLLVFKLFVLFVAGFFGWQLGKLVVRSLWSVVQPVLQFVWMGQVCKAPVPAARDAGGRAVGRELEACRHAGLFQGADESTVAGTDKVTYEVPDAVRAALPLPAVRTRT